VIISLNSINQFISLEQKDEKMKDVKVTATVRYLEAHMA
jgi:hypothetical protein